MSHAVPRTEPPSEWASADPLGSDVYWSKLDPLDGKHTVVGDVLVWHWCPGMSDGRWIARNVQNHTLVTLEPLHLEPSLLWDCCGRHGWIRDGLWSEA